MNLRITAFSILITLLAVSSTARDMTLEKITTDPTDMSATRGNIKDFNGVPCALVKVCTTASGMVFEGGIIGTPEFKAGEYWVWMSKGTRFLRIKHAQSEPLMIDFADYYSGGLESKQTYVLKVSSPETAIETVTFRVSPADAVLAVDQKEYPANGGIATLNLPVGEHNYVVFAPGYTTEGSSFIVKSNQTNKIIIALDPKVGSIAAVSMNHGTTQAQSSQQPTGTVDFASVKAEADKAYDNGYYNRALELYMKISDNSGIQNRIGYMYKYAKGVTKDYEEAVRWYRKAAEGDFAPGQNNLGVMYESGYGVNKDYAEAVRWYRKAAEQGNKHGQYNLADMYEDGKGIEQNYTEAIRWYLKAAEQGHSSAQCQLGYLYRNGKGVAPNYAEAVRWYKKAVAQGHDRAQYNLALMYRNGEGVDKNDYEAVRLYRLSAEQDYANAQNSLGYMYEFGKGVSQDYAEAKKWYMKSADQGNAYAQSNLADLYYYGRGVEKNYYEAVKWYRKAAEQGNAYSQYSLGFCLYKGLGVSENRQDAYHWLKKAADNGNQSAKDFISSHTF